MKKEHVTWTNIWKDINILCPEEMKKTHVKYEFKWFHN